MVSARLVRSLRHLGLLVGCCAGAGTALVSSAYGVGTSTVTVSLRAQGAGLVSSGAFACQACTFVAARGSVVTARQAPAENFAFEGWSGACAGVAPTCVFIADTNPVVVTGTFVRTTTTVSVSVGGQGTITSDPPGIDCGVDTNQCSATFGTATTVALTETPRPGFAFVGWQRGCDHSKQTRCDLPVLGSPQATAVFTNTQLRPIGETRQLTAQTLTPVTSNPQGIACSPPGGVCSASFAVGTVVELYGGAGWSGACVGHASTCPVVLDTNLTVTAEVPVTAVSKSGYGLTVNATSGGSVRISGHFMSSDEVQICRLPATAADCGAYFDPNSQVQLVAQRHSGLRFVRWSGVYCAGRTSRTCQFEITHTGSTNAVYAHAP
jgi:hypothetical protein